MKNLIKIRRNLAEILSVPLVAFFAVVLSAAAQGDEGKETKNEIYELNISLTLPNLDVSPYHKPYVSVWLETIDREHLATLALWVEKEDWFKDLRQWWRKAARLEKDQWDGQSGATRVPGQYQIIWQAQVAGEAIPPGDYWLHFEASREEGGRSYFRQKITFGKQNFSYKLGAKEELGPLLSHSLR